MDSRSPSKTDQILDLLLDALLERQLARQEMTEQQSPDDVKRPTERPAGASEQRPLAASPPAPSVSGGADMRQEAISAAPVAEDAGHPEEVVSDYDAAYWGENPPFGESDLEAAGVVEHSGAAATADRHLGPMLRRLSMALALLLVIINIPLNRYGTSLARAMPDHQALIIRDGLLLKGSGPEVYVLEENRRRWISTLDAFEHYGYRWEQVHEVDDKFLESFAEGAPIHLLLKCSSSPHVFALEDGAKRWIKDIPTFEQMGYRWEEIRFVSCDELRALPDGVPIPEDAGAPPQP